MKVTEISVSYEETCSLPGYNNVRPGVRLTAQFEESELSYDYFLHALQDKARIEVQKEIDDALVRSHKAPKYSKDPRYMILHSSRRKVVLVVPDNSDAYPDDFNQTFYGGIDTSGLLLSQAQEYGKLAADREGETLMTIQDGDYSALPPLPTNKTWIPDENYDPEDDDDDIDDDDIDDDDL